MTVSCDEEQMKGKFAYGTETIISILNSMVLRFLNSSEKKVMVIIKEVR